MRPQVRNKRKRTSQFRGVSKAGAKWKATITANGSKQELGRFDTELEAAQCARPPQTLHWCTVGGVACRVAAVGHLYLLLMSQQGWPCCYYKEGVCMAASAISSPLMPTPSASATCYQQMRV